MEAVAKKDYKMSVVTHPELGFLNTKFGATISKLHIKYHDAIYQEIIDSLDSPTGPLYKALTSNAGNTKFSAEQLSGSPSIKNILLDSIISAFTTGKNTQVKVESAAAAALKGQKTKAISKVSNVVNKSSKPKKKDSKSKNVAPTKINVKVRSNNSKVKSGSSKTKEAGKVVKPKSTLVIPKTVTVNTAKQTRLRSASGNVTSVTNVQNLLNLNLFETIKRNMYSPRLNFRTGRFAKSATIKSITHGQDDVIDIRYTYMRNVYGTFEPGGKQGSPSRDPKSLISGSIREALRGQVLQKLRITRV